MPFHWSERTVEPTHFYKTVPSESQKMGQETLWFPAPFDAQKASILTYLAN